MVQSYVIELIKTLNDDERTDLLLYADSPLHNRSVFAREAQLLLKIILDAAPGFDEKKLDKNRVYELLFPGKQFVDGKLEKVMVELNKITRAYMLTTHYLSEQNETRQLLDFAKILRIRGLENRYHQALARLGKQIENETRESSQLYYWRYALEYELHSWQTITNKHKGDLNLPRVMKQFHQYYLLKQTEFVNTFKLQNILTNLETSSETELVLDSIHLPPGYHSDGVLLPLTEKIHKLLAQEQPEEKEFRELLEYITLHEDHIESDTLKNTYAYLRNFCSLLIDAGNVELTPTLHEIHKNNLERGFLYYEGQIPPYAYLNIAMAAIKALNPEWALEFVEKNQDKIIGENESRDFYRITRGICLFALKKYGEALDILPPTSAYSSFYLTARRLELKIYHETDSDLLPYKIDAFKMFISRASQKVLSVHLRELHSNFINILYQVSQSRKGDKKRSEQLTKRLAEKKLVAERSWLQEKIADLEQP